MDMNFIHVVPKLTQKSVNRWLRVSTFLLTSLCVTAAYLEIKQRNQLYALQAQEEVLQNKQKKFAANIAQHETLKKKQASLTKQLSVIENFNKKKQVTYQRLAALSNALESDMNLTSVSLTPDKPFEMTGTCPKVNNALSFLDKLNKCEYFNGCTLKSLQPDAGENNHTLNFIAQGNVS